MSSNFICLEKIGVMLNDRASLVQKQFFWTNSCLAIVGIGWALSSRFSQASRPGGLLFQSKVLLRSHFAPETLTIVEHLTSAIGTPCLLTGMIWYFYSCLQKNRDVDECLRRNLGDLYIRHFARVTVYFALGTYLVHQFEKEVLEAASNLAFHFYWDLTGLAICYALLSPFFRGNVYALLHLRRS